MSVPVYRHMTGSANQINVTSVYRHTVCNCERASLRVLISRSCQHLSARGPRGPGRDARHDMSSIECDIVTLQALS